jgi:protein tyrosine/serine phosphatase
MGAQRVRISILATCFAAVSITVPAIAQTSTSAASLSSGLSGVRIGNFGKINDHYFRGSQPKGADYKDLAALGVKTVIDLQKDGPSNESGLVTAAGMKFFRIGMTTTNAPTDTQIAQFFEIVNDPANQPVYVHCAGGRHRTGTMTALYRMTFDGWNAEKAYNEMKQYRFEGFPDHPVLRNYVYAFKPALPKQPTVLATNIVTAK